MPWVVDCSMALAWGLPDEHSPAAETFLRSIPPGEPLWVPGLFWYEIANALVVAQRRRHGERIRRKRHAGRSLRRLGI